MRIYLKTSKYPLFNSTNILEVIDIPKTLMFSHKTSWSYIKYRHISHKTSPLKIFIHIQCLYPLEANFVHAFECKFTSSARGSSKPIWSVCVILLKRRSLYRLCELVQFADGENVADATSFSMRKVKYRTVVVLCFTEIHSSWHFPRRCNDVENSVRAETIRGINSCRVATLPKVW